MCKGFSTVYHFTPTLGLIASSDSSDQKFSNFGGGAIKFAAFFKTPKVVEFLEKG